MTERQTNLSGKLQRGLHAAFARVQCESASKLALRNGGAESYLRALSLDGIEQSTGCVAFLEADRKRVDAVLRCPSSGECRAAIEFKHNFSHQTKAIEISRIRAKEQLLQHGDAKAEKFYVHFVTSLEANDPGSGFAEFHNRYVSTGYKKFYSPDLQAQALAQVEKGFGCPPAGRYALAQYEHARAVLFCWVARLEGDAFQPLRG